MEDYQSREISLQNKLDEQSSEVKLLQERLLSVQSQLSSMEDDQDRNNGTINTLSDQLRSAKKDVESLTNRLRDRERHSENLDHNIKLLKGQLSTVSRRSDSNNSDVKKILVERAEYEEKNQELKLLIAHMESSAKSLSQKYNKVTIALESAEREIKNYEKKLEMANSTLTERDEKLKMLQSSLENLDREHDRIQELLDSAEDEACKRNEYSQSLERQLQQTKELLAQNEKKLKQNQTEIVNCQRANNIIQAKFNSLQVENQDLKQRLSYKHQEVGGAAEDLLLMTKENQALTSELAITTSERDAARLQLHEHMQTTAEVEQSRRALEIEKNDLLETYRTVINEKRKLESELEKMGYVFDNFLHCLLYLH